METTTSTFKKREKKRFSVKQKNCDDETNTQIIAAVSIRDLKYRFSFPTLFTYSFNFFSLSLPCSANLSDAWSPHHHHLAAEKQKKKYFSWTRNVFINYCVIVKQQKEKNYLKNILTFFIFLLSVWLYKLNVITKSEHIT